MKIYNENSPIAEIEFGGTVVYFDKNGKLVDKPKELVETTNQDTIDFMFYALGNYFLMRSNSLFNCMGGSKEQYEMETVSLTSELEY
jgi:hypothetical protein